jgi:two-component system invasion response regulator UvrY
MISMIVVDDQNLVRAAIVRLLSELPHIQILAEADSGEEAVRLAKEKSPDLILMDINMPGIGGLEAIRRILIHNPDIKILALTSCIHDPFPSRILQAGVKGYLTKGANLEKMTQAIRTVAAGQVYLDPEIAQNIALKNVAGTGQSAVNDLSKRELEILARVVKGIDVATIAEKLCISPKTVNTYRYRIYEKLNVQNDVELTWFALRQGLFELEEGF